MEHKDRARSGGVSIRHHFVSQGLQRNFATAKFERLTIFDPSTGDVIDPDRRIRDNFAIDEFNTFYHADGEPDRQLEAEFARIERTALNSARHVSLRDQTPARRASAAEVFAIHLIRSPAHRRFLDRVHARSRAELVGDAADHAEANLATMAPPDRNLTRSEIEVIAQEAYSHPMETNAAHISAMIRHYNWTVELLNGMHLQVVETDRKLPGFVLGDIPVVHYQPTDGRFGFDSDLAIGDAGSIIGAITRRKAVLFTTRPEPSVRTVDRAGVYRINALLIRGASHEVACHPDDLDEAQTVVDNLAVLLRVGPSPSSYVPID